MAEVRDMYNYTGCGLPNVWLRNGYTVRETKYGETIAIDDINGLHRAIALDIVENNSKLTGAEVRFLRKELDWSQANLAKYLGISTNTVRGWENNRQAIAPPAERLLRVLCQEHLQGDGHVRELVNRISEQNRNEYEQLRKITFEVNARGWHSTADAA